jgi:hypothetical protein
VTRKILASILRSILWGAGGFAVFVGFSLLSAQILPRDPHTDYQAYLLRHSVQIITEKIAGLAIVAVIAMFAARSFRPTAIWGLVTGVNAGLAFQLVVMCVYLVRFGLQAYTTWTRFIPTLLWTLGIAFVFGVATIWRQLKSEQTHNA